MDLFSELDAIHRQVDLDAVDGDTVLELEHTVPLAMAGSAAGALFVGSGWDGALMGARAVRPRRGRRRPRRGGGLAGVVEFNRHSIDRWAAEASGAAPAEEIEGGKQAALAQFVPDSR
ncbi:hypothetical protein [Actinomycetospora chibensis]|uniref:Uncharacterized protein n=1 Tax=Actinomycetospora chibensis TaxID=663606 RepID=A0ABV9RFN0_9PSEU|nr:hypothetical protein [Actinomycetospora chibensis]MDD7927786.1 hypothetical protein [Actinomycetospora chibensis]